MRRSQGPTRGPRGESPGRLPDLYRALASRGPTVNSRSTDAEWELFYLDRELATTLAGPRVYADEEFNGLRDDLQRRQLRPRSDPD